MASSTKDRVVPMEVLSMGPSRTGTGELLGEHPNGRRTFGPAREFSLRRETTLQDHGAANFVLRHVNFFSLEIR